MSQFTPPRVVTYNKFSLNLLEGDNIVGVYGPDLEKILKLKNISNITRTYSDSCKKKLSKGPLTGYFLSVPAVQKLCTQATHDIAQPFLEFLRNILPNDLSSYGDFGEDTSDTSSSESSSSSTASSSNKRSCDVLPADKSPKGKKKLKAAPPDPADGSESVTQDVSSLDWSEVIKTVDQTEELVTRLPPGLSDTCEKMKKVKEESAQVSQTPIRVVLFAKPYSGKTATLHQLLRPPRDPYESIEAMHKWESGLFPTRHTNPTAKPLTEIITSVECKGSSDNCFACYIDTLSFEMYSKFMSQGARRASNPPKLEFKNVCYTVKWGARRERIYSAEKETDVYLFYAYLNALPEADRTAISLFHVVAPYDDNIGFIFVDLPGISDATNSAAYHLCKEEIQKAHVILCVGNTVVDPNTLIQLGDIGAFDNPSCIPIVYGFAQSKDKVTVVIPGSTNNGTTETPKSLTEVQISNVEKAIKDPRFLKSTDPLLRDLIGRELKHNTEFVFSRETLSSRSTRTQFFKTLKDKALQSYNYKIIRGCCSILFRICANGSIGNVDRKINAFNGTVTMFEEDKESLQRIAVAHCENFSREFSAYVATVSKLDPDIMLDRVYQSLKALIKKQKLMCDNRLTSIFLHRDRNILLPVEDIIIAEKDEIFGKIAMKYTQQLIEDKCNESHIASILPISKSSAESKVKRVAEKMNDIANSIDVHGHYTSMLKNQFAPAILKVLKDMKNVTSTVGGKNTTPPDVLNNANALIAKWRTTLMMNTVHSHSHLNRKDKHPKSKFKVETLADAMDNIHGIEHVELMEYIPGILLKRCKDNFVVPQLQLPKYRETISAESNIIKLDPPSRNLIIGAAAKAKLEAIKTLNTLNSIALFVPTKITSDFPVNFKRLDFNCLDSNVVQTNSVVVVVVERSQLKQYVDHCAKLAKKCNEKFNYAMMVVPDNSPLEVTMEMIRVVVLHYNLEYFFVAPENVSVLLHFKLQILRLKKCSPARSFVWVQQIAERVKTKLLEYAYDAYRVVKEHMKAILACCTQEESLNLLMQTLGIPLEISSAAALTQKHVQLMLSFLKHRGDIEDIEISKRLEDAFKKLLATEYTLAKFVSISMIASAGAYNGMIRQYPNYILLLPPDGYQVQGPTLFIADALKYLPFCNLEVEYKDAYPDCPEKGLKRIVRAQTDKKTTHKRPKAEEPARWVDACTKAHQDRAKTWRAKGAYQLQTSLFTWSAVTKVPGWVYKKEVRPMLIQAKKEKKVRKARSVALPVIDPSEKRELCNLLLSQYTLIDNDGGADCMLCALTHFIRDLDRDAVLNFVQDNFKDFKKDKRLGPLLGDKVTVKQFINSHVGQTTYCNNDFAYIVAWMYGFQLKIFRLNPDTRELVVETLTPPTTNKNTPTMRLAYTQNHWMAVEHSRDIMADSQFSEPSVVIVDDTDSENDEYDIVDSQE